MRRQSTRGQRTTRTATAGWALLVPAAALVLGCQLGEDDTRWVSVQTEDLVVGVDVAGQLASTESHPLGPPSVLRLWNFKIAFMASEGDEVKKGQPVLGFDASTLRQRLEEYQNEADSATKELAAHQASTRMARREGELEIKKAEAQERKAELLAKGSREVVAANELAQASLDLELAAFSTEVARRKVAARSQQDRAELERLQGVKRRAEQHVERIRNEMGRMRVAAPIDGTVLYIADWEGNKKKIGDSVWRAIRVMEVVSLEHMKAEGEVDEMDASRVAVGHLVRLRLDANADVELTGKVIEIVDAVQRRAPDDPLKVVKLEIALDANAEVELRPGMRFRGTIETERIENVLQVPLEAIHADAEGAFVFRKEGRDVAQARVTLGRRSRDRVEVLSGLEAGDQAAVVEAAKSEEPSP